jgi:integrase-like protein
MLEMFFKSPLRIQELHASPESCLLEGFAREIVQAGYAEITARRHIRAAEHLVYWTARESMPITTLGERFVEEFSHHLDQCQCPGYGHTHRMDLLNGVRLFFGYLRRAGALKKSIAAPIVQDPILFASFCQWMRQQRGTCDLTLYNYGIDLRDLLKKLGEDPSRFNASGLRTFVLERSQRCGWAAAKRCTTAIRMFLRFLIADGKCSVGLDASIPAIAHWRLSSLPRYLQSEEVERVIASCNPATQVGRRDRAIVLLLARLGVRAGDIVQLRLCDLDWKEAWIRVSGKDGVRHCCR